MPAHPGERSFALHRRVGQSDIEHECRGGRLEARALEGGQDGQIIGARSKKIDGHGGNAGRHDVIGKAGTADTSRYSAVSPPPQSTSVVIFSRNTCSTNPSSHW